MMRRWSVIAAACVLGGLAIVRVGWAQTRIWTPPNVIIFLTDDQGTLDAGCYGSHDLTTPHIDDLAARGIRFTQAYAHVAGTGTRAMLLTGRHPQRGGINDAVQVHPFREGINMLRSEITLAEVLRKARYRTAIFGKWHLGAALTQGPRTQGFDEFFGIRGSLVDKYNHTTPHLQRGERPFHDLYRGDVEVFRKGKYLPDLIVAEAVRFLEENKFRNFFLYVPLTVPHFPEQGDALFEARYQYLPMPRRSYATMISTVDDRIGKIMAKVDALEMRENTIIVFMSDNGHSTEQYTTQSGEIYGANGGGGNTGPWRGAKGTFFEGGIRVPAIISFPLRLPQSQIRDHAIIAADFFPTILNLCNVPLPARTLDGKSLLPIIEFPGAASPHRELHWQWQDRWAAREGPWKLVAEWELGQRTYHLGNLAEEQPEMKNYVTERRDIVRRLTDMHNAWAREIRR